MPGRDLGGHVREHRVAHRGGDREALAEGRDGPLDDHLGGRELELGAGVPDQLLELGLAAALGVVPLKSAGCLGGGGGHRGTSCRGGGSGRAIMPSIFSENARRQAWHSQAPWPSSLGRRFSSPQ